MFGSQIRAFRDTNIYRKKHKTERTVYTFSIPSLRARTASVSNSNLKIGDQIQQGITWPTVGQRCMW